MDYKRHNNKKYQILILNYSAAKNKQTNKQTKNTAQKTDFSVGCAFFCMQLQGHYGSFS